MALPVGGVALFLASIIRNIPKRRIGSNLLKKLTNSSSDFTMVKRFTIVLKRFQEEHYANKKHI